MLDNLLTSRDVALFGFSSLCFLRKIILSNKPIKSAHNFFLKPNLLHKSAEDLPNKLVNVFNL